MLIFESETELKTEMVVLFCDGEVQQKEKFDAENLGVYDVDSNVNF